MTLTSCLLACQLAVNPLCAADFTIGDSPLDIFNTEELSSYLGGNDEETLRTALAAHENDPLGAAATLRILAALPDLELRTEVEAVLAASEHSFLLEECRRYLAWLDGEITEPDDDLTHQLRSLSLLPHDAWMVGYARSVPISLDAPNRSALRQLLALQSMMIYGGEDAWLWDGRQIPDEFDAFLAEGNPMTSQMLPELARGAMLPFLTHYDNIAWGMSGSIDNPTVVLVLSGDFNQEDIVQTMMGDFFAPTVQRHDTCTVLLSDYNSMVISDDCMAFLFGHYDNAEAYAPACAHMVEVLEDNALDDLQLNRTMVPQMLEELDIYTDEPLDAIFAAELPLEMREEMAQEFDYMDLPFELPIADLTSMAISAIYQGDNAGMNAVFLFNDESSARAGRAALRGSANMLASSLIEMGYPEECTLPLEEVETDLQGPLLLAHLDMPTNILDTIQETYIRQMHEQWTALREEWGDNIVDVWGRHQEAGGAVVAAEAPVEDDIPALRQQIDFMQEQINSFNDTIAMMQEEMLDADGEEAEGIQMMIQSYQEIINDFNAEIASMEAIIAELEAEAEEDDSATEPAVIEEVAAEEPPVPANNAP